MQLARYRKPESFIDELDKLFHSAFVDSFDRFFDNTSTGPRVPVISSQEDKDNIYLKVELPGVKKEDIKVDFQDSILTIKAESSKNEKHGDSTVKESYYFERSMQIPNYVAHDKVNGSFENGLLTLTLPKTEERKPRQIMIK